MVENIVIVMIENIVIVMKSKLIDFLLVWQ